MAVVAAVAAAVLGFRAAYIEPRAWGVACAMAPSPFVCLPRAGLLWLQREYLYGGIALALGLYAFLRRGPLSICVGAVAVGFAGVANYNATWGMVGAALGVWTWISLWQDGDPPERAGA